MIYELESYHKQHQQQPKKKTVPNQKQMSKINKHTCLMVLVSQSLTHI